MLRPFTRRPHLFHLGKTSTCLLLTAMLWGCGSDHPMTPAGDASVDAHLAGGAGGNAVLHYHGEGDFGPDDGGTLKIKGSKLVFHIGPDALPAPMTIEADVWVYKTKGKVERIEFQFSPPSVFLEPIQLEIPLKYAGPLADEDGEYILLYFDPEEGEWEESDEGEVGRKTVVFDVEHFSKYAIGRD